MSRRQPRGPKNPVVWFVCTGRDSHKERRLLRAESDGAGVVSYMVKGQGGSTDDGHGRRESWRLVCPSCGRDRQMNRETLEGGVGRAVAADVRKLDVSKVR